MTNRVVKHLWHSPLAPLTLYADDEHILALCFPENEERIVARLGLAKAEESATPLIREAVRQLQQYFAAERKVFDLPLRIQGSPFQELAWRSLLAIPFGETRSYSDQASAIGRGKAVRAIGTANGQNAISILIPCHRVLGKHGGLAGYAGGMAVKSALLQLEGHEI